MYYGFNILFSMFERILTFVAAAAAAVTISSCQKDDKPTVEFEKSLYTVYAQRSVDVGIIVSEPPTDDITVRIVAAGAVEGTDFELTGNPVTIKAGETSGTFRVKNLALTESKAVTLGIECPSGYEPGSKFVTVITPDPEETLVYSFQTTKADVLGSYVASINVTGVTSGDKLSLGNDVAIPLKITGEAAEFVAFESLKTRENASYSGPFAVLKAGKSTATFKFSLKDGFKDGDKVSITVDLAKASRFIPGENESAEYTLYSVNVPEAILGTWTFSKVFAKDELDFWFEEVEDDPALLPTKNEGFTLTFTKDASGVVTVTPNDKGDFANFFREATVTPTEPKNYSSEGVVTGKNSVSECSMFMAYDGYSVHTNTYYLLSAANRAFSKDKETIGEAVVVFTIIDGKLAVEFRDYDTPPFGAEWWGDGSKFDADMFGFASLFVKQ